MWTPYEKVRGRKPDFLVEYRVLSEEEGGRKFRTSQGYRSDLHYEGEDLDRTAIHMVHPEFLGNDGAIVLDDTIFVDWTGFAYMWILSFKERWNYHRRWATPGRVCWFMEGRRKTVEAIVVEQIGLTHIINEAS